MSTRIADGFSEIHFALRRPEQFLCRWRDRKTLPDEAPDPLVFALLLGSAIVGLAAYGLAMGIGRGPAAMLAAAIEAPTAAGIAWGLALPALYVVQSANGSRLDLSTTLLAALSTVSFASLAMLAGVPIHWFFALALPNPIVRTAITMLTFAGVGFCMCDVFLRTMRALEPERSLGFPVVWLGLLAVIGAELMWLVGLFDF